jgi:hypothetical protein
VKGRSADQPIMMILSPKGFLHNKPEANAIISALKLSKRWIKWNTECLDKVKSEGEKDKGYTKDLNYLLENEEQEQNILYQEEGILY